MFLFTLWAFHSYDIFWPYYPPHSSSQTSSFLLTQLHVSHYFLRQRLSLYGELTRIARLAGQQAPGLLLSLLLQSCDHRCWPQSQGRNSKPQTVMLGTSQVDPSPQPTLCTFKATAPMWLLDSFFPLDMAALRCYEKWIHDCPRETQGRTQPPPLGFSQFKTWIWFHFKRKFFARKGGNPTPGSRTFLWEMVQGCQCHVQQGELGPSFLYESTLGKLTASLFLSFLIPP